MPLIGVAVMWTTFWRMWINFKARYAGPPVLAKLPLQALKISFSYATQTIDALLLHGCGWNDDSFSTLAAVLPTLVCCSALVHLNVADNQIGDGGMTALADSLGV